MKKVLILIFSIIAISASAQNSEKYPFFFNSVTLEFADPITYFAQHDYNRSRIPSTFVSYEGRIKNKFYGEAGISFGREHQGVLIYKSSSFHQEFGINCYVGGLLKFQLFKNFYFTPSLDFYYSLIKTWHTNKDTLSENSRFYTMGPTIGFEFFISRRLSFSTDILNVNYGLHTYYSQPTLYSYGSWHRINQFTIYKVLSLGIHYNFDWKRNKLTEASGIL